MKNKTIIPLVMSAAMLASCDHYDRTDGRAMVTGGSFYPVFTPQPRQVARPVAKPAAPAPRPAASPTSQHQPRVALTPPPAPQPAPKPVAIPAPAPQPAAKPAPIPAPAPAAQEEQPAKPTYAVMPGQNRGLRVRPRR